MELRKNKKEVVLSRLKQAAARIWGYRESETEGFDPLIELLFGSCAAEFEQLSTELYNSQSRILEKVSQILLPEVNLRPSPAYAILMAKPVIAERLTDPTDQFIFEKETETGPSGKSESKKVYFSPTSVFRVIDAEVALMATTHEIIRVSELSKEAIIRSQIHQIPQYNRLWIGLKINRNVKTLKDVSFYFDWYNNPDKSFLLKLLPLAQWFVNGMKINIKSGFSRAIDSIYKAETLDIMSFLDINLKTEKKINLFFEDNYITIDQDILPDRRKYLTEFMDFFPPDELEKLKEDLCWIEIGFPDIFPVEYLTSTFCIPNAVPVINRRLHSLNRPYTLNADLNIIPILSDDLFFTIRNIISSNHINYQEVPFKKASDFAPGTYTIRTKGVKRFDERDAYEHTEYLLELLREEYVAFKSIGSSLIEKELNDLLVIINRLRINALKSNEVKSNTHFIIMKSEMVEDIWLEFWSTTGTFGNNIPMGSPCVHNDFDKKTLKLLTATAGGKNPPDQLERTFLFKNELLARDRIVTREDIRILCQAELGNDLKDISVTQSTIMGKNRSTGFQNCLLVKLFLSDRKSVIEKANIANHMEKSLQQKSSCMYNYKVECVD